MAFENLRPPQYDFSTLANLPKLWGRQGQQAPRPMSEYEKAIVDIKTAQEARQKAKADFAATKQDNQRKYYLAKSQDIIKHARELAKHKGLERSTGGLKLNILEGAPGPFGQMARDLVGLVPAGAVPSMPESDPANFEPAVRTLKNKIGFTELQAMRNYSTTGGALGQVAVQEIDFLQQSIEALDLIQDPKVMRKALNDIADHYQKLQEIMSDPNWGRGPTGVAAPDAGGAPDANEYEEGDEAINPETGQTLTYTNGAWQ